MSHLTDSHMHFDAFDRAGEVDAILDRARQAGVKRILAIGGSEEANQRVVRLCRSYPDILAGAVGYDRDEAGGTPDLGVVESMVAERGITGIGETGLDYHYSSDTAEAQKRLLEQMLEIAAAHTLPVVLHSREADADMLALLTRHVAAWRGEPGAVGVLHCFTGGEAFARNLLELGFLISFSGIVTFKKSDALRAVAQVVPDDRILVETDAPYLAPVPYRGKRNEPAYVRHTAEVLAEVRGCAWRDLAALTSRNAERLFSWAEPVP